MKAIVHSMLLAGLAAASASADVVFDVFGIKHTFVMQGTTPAAYPGTLNTTYDGYPNSTVTGSKKLYVRIPSDRRWGWQGGTIEAPRLPPNLPNYPVVYDPWRAISPDRTPIVGVLGNVRSPLLMIQVPPNAKTLTVEMDLDFPGDLSGIPAAPNAARVTTNCFAGVISYGTDSSNYRDRKVEQMVAPVVRLSAPNAAGTGHSLGWYSFASFAEMLPTYYPSTTSNLTPYLPTGSPYLFSTDVATANTTGAPFSHQWSNSVFPNPKRFTKSFTVAVPTAWQGNTTQVALEFVPFMIRNWEDRIAGGNKGDLVYFAPTGGKVTITSTGSLTGTVTAPTNKLVEGYKGSIPIEFSISQ